MYQDNWLNLFRRWQTFQCFRLRYDETVDESRISREEMKKKKEKRNIFVIFGIISRIYISQPCVAAR